MTSEELKIKNIKELDNLDVQYQKERTDLKEKQEKELENIRVQYLKKKEDLKTKQRKEKETLVLEKHILDFAEFFAIVN